MPIDPDAYMSGAIPTLSQGGSRSAMGSPAPTSTAGWQTQVMGAMSYARNLGGATSHSGVSSQAGSMRSQLTPRLTPFKHEGWAKESAGPRRAPVAPMDIPSVIGPRPRVTSDYSNSIIEPPHVQPHLRHSPAEHFWEHGAGSPKLMTPEQDYFQYRSPQQMTAADLAYHRTSPSRVMPHRKKAESLPSPTMPPLPSPRHRAVTLAQERDAGRRASAPLYRRHSSDMLERQLRHERRQLDPLSPSLGGMTMHTSPTTSRAGNAQAPSSSKIDQAGSLPLPSKSPYIRVKDLKRMKNDLPTRPPMTRRHTSSHAETPETKSPPRSALKVRTSSHTGLPELNYANDSHSKSVIDPHTPSFSLRSLSEALPSPTIVARGTPPPGYISPLADEGYDRYAAHPAAPTPAQIHGKYHNVTSSSQVTMVDETDESSEQYLPMGYARPTRDIAWNREGPAMKTHGIAWLREGDANALPARPQGPRWTQARPPRTAVVSGGSHWDESG